MKAFSPFDRYIAVDIETTGLSPVFDRIIEIGAVAIENNVVVGEYSSLIATDRKISKTISKIHGLTNEILTGKNKPQRVIPEFLDFVRKGIFVFHNAKFDLEFLRQECGRLGITFHVRHVCTLEITKRLFPHLGSYRLQNVYSDIFGSLPPDIHLHRALDDARLIAGIWMEIKKK